MTKTLRQTLTRLLCPLALGSSALAAVQAQAGPGLHVERLRCEYNQSPLCVSAAHPRLSWQSASETRGQRQSAYEVLVASSLAALKANRGDLWDSGKVASDHSTVIAYAGTPLRSGQPCWWKVRLWDKDGRPSPAGPTGFWQMGLLKPSDWKAQWISAVTPRDTKDNGVTLPPSPYLCRTFTLAKRVKRATLYATAHGLYEMHLNGARVGEDVLAPGWTDYRKHIQYQAYDVTTRLHPGANAVGAILGDGWYAGYVGFARQRDLYGDRPQLRAQINIEYTDGTHTTVASDGSWRGGTGPILFSDMLMGETYDARRELPGWDRAGFSDPTWKPAVADVGLVQPHQADVTGPIKAAVKDDTLTIVAGNDLAGDPAYNTVKQLRVDYTLGGTAHTQTVNEKETLQIPASGETPGTLVIRHAVYGALDEGVGAAALVGMTSPPVRVIREVHPRRITRPTPGVYLYDLGQNMVGWARLTVRGAAGTKVRMRFGEVLNPDGTLYTTNLRSARATDTYLCRGGGLESWEPHFTFHGFRYVEVTGYPGKPGLSALTGRVVSSDTPRTGTFVCSHPMVNQLQSNILWGQRGNFLSVPTDCPQRDERLGWMGDAQIFARTATYNSDVAAFYEKWMQDVEDAQSPAGGFSDVSPRLVDQADGAPAWGDAGIIVPWTVYLAYGDTTILANHWTAMTHWMDYITSVNPQGLWEQHRNNDFGDWLSIAADTPKDVLATAYYAYDAQLMARMARGLGRTDEAEKYQALFEHIKSAFNTAYVSPDGRIKGDTQTVYVLALRFNLLPPDLRSSAAQHLVDDIKAKKGHLSTGFVGVGYLCPVLTATGHNSVAYQLLLNDTFPSWGFSIKQGATTIWERWDGWTPKNGFQDPGMNSFNHYSLGSVGQWLYQDVAGIDTDPDQPGYKHILLHPQPGPGLSFVRASLVSPYGTIRSDWKVAAGRFLWTITIPANTTATVWVPVRDPAKVRESGKIAGSVSGISALRTEADSCVYELGSGTYHFVAASRPE